MSNQSSDAWLHCAFIIGYSVESQSRGLWLIVPRRRVLEAVRQGAHLPHLCLIQGPRWRNNSLAVKSWITLAPDVSEALDAPWGVCEGGVSVASLIC